MRCEVKILKVIHGYPMRYNAGSEVYSQTLCHKLAKKYELQIFTREENTFAPDYTMHSECDFIDKSIKLNVINIPLEKHRYQYRIEEVDQQFEKIISSFEPDIVHIGHLNHLSTSLITKIPNKIPIIYTLHDYWLICPRGQFIQRVPENVNEVWGMCDGQNDLKCAVRCYSGYFSGSDKDFSYDSSYWTNWVKRRNEYIKKLVKKVDYFIAPSQFLLEKFKTELAVPTKKLIYLDYGFDLERFRKRARVPREPFTFGYIGTHIPAKGIQLLIEAFGRLKGKPLLRIWGRPRGENTCALKAIAKSLPSEANQRIEWLPEYNNQQITKDVFNRVDAIVVPSIWHENSPLVIHEALQARVPIVTANVGGMSEYVQHKVNGLLFTHRNIGSLAKEMQCLYDNPKLATKLGARGYIQSDNGNIPCIDKHASSIEQIYLQALREKGSKA
jgi:glycosyltransferase involved in cell wall biosynthesis